MTKGAGRGFTTTDATVLGAATAVGLALALARPGAGEPFPLHHLKDGLLPGLAPAVRQVVLGWSVVGAWTLALVALRSTTPRPAGRRRFAAPGTSACAIAAVMLGLEAAYVAANEWAFRIRRAPRLERHHLLALLRSLKHEAVVAPSIGFAVAAWWAALALGGRWRRARGWIDRAGLAVGGLWIALAVLMFHLRTNANFLYR